MVDCDLEAFFDNVNQDILMAQLSKKHQDAPRPRLINRYLKAGVQSDGIRTASIKGVPQGGPLSTILANIVLNRLGWTLEKRGYRFVREERHPEVPLYPD